MVALIDGEHYPPVVRFALDELRRSCEVAGAVFVGGTEKVDAGDDAASYGVPVVRGPDAGAALADAIARFLPEAIVDLSDEPVLSAADRFALASVALHHGVAYEGADFAFDPPIADLQIQTPSLAIVGTGKRVGKTAISAYVARFLAGQGHRVVVVAMGRGGPAEPELIRGDEVALSTEDLLALVERGVHAASDNYEDAVMSRVATVGCRRCGGGLAGKTFFSNVEQGARLADGLGSDLVILEGSGSAIPPVRSDAAMLVVGARQGVSYVRDYFGPYRLNLADAVVVAGAEQPLVSREEVSCLVAAIRRLRQDIPVVCTTFRPKPLADVSGARVFFATTAPPEMLGILREHLERTYGCQVVAASAALSNRAELRAELRASAGRFDLLLTELKAAAIDVVAMAGAESGVPTVLCDNVPIDVGGDGLEATIDRAHRLARRRSSMRSL